MKKQDKRRNKKVKNLVFICAICAILLTVSTYAWFIGMKTVNVSSFDIEIATTEGLFLSMDGKTWTYNLDARNVQAYADNTNTWAPEGLIPMSTIGEMDATASRMILYEKGSLTTTKGGYRLLASRVDNSTAEKKGYVAFDLFIKNLSGEAYYTENNPLNEEAIYLTTNSKVTVSNQGGESGTGIENSVRVAFAQVGRVIGSTGADQAADITGITCSNSNEDGHAQVTGICRAAQIWEPNDSVHVQNAINWYDTSCRTRKAGTEGATVSSDSSYNASTKCTGVLTTNAVDAPTPTYAISRVIGIDDNVDIYDGLRYNTYVSNSQTYEAYAAAIKNKTGEALTTAKADFKLVEFPYFTDTMKDKTGTDRPIFMTLAPNSITKVRVYVYIEGQDIDNYDFASLGKKISVEFGFTKERFFDVDVNYDGSGTTATLPDDVVKAKHPTKGE